MAKGSRTRGATKEYTTSNGTKIIGDVYCRKCMEHKHPKEFYAAVDSILDLNGLMSVCKSCSNEIYDKEYVRLRTFKKAILSTCRILNMAYDKSAVDATYKTVVSLEEKGRDVKSIVGIYRGRLASMNARGSETIESSFYNDLTFVEPTRSISYQEGDEDIYADEERLQQDEFWGDSFSTEQLDFLEREYNSFTRTHLIETHADIVLLKEVCYLLLEIHENRMAGNSTISDVKELQRLLKTLAVSPDMQNAANSGDNLELYSSKIKYIEEHEPSELLDELTKREFRDVDSYELYYENMVRRPTINYNADLADYTIKDELGNVEDWEIKD
jgi:hypothetical protein